MPTDTDLERRPNAVPERVRSEPLGEAHFPRRGAPNPQDRQEEPSYYDIPMLKPPVWKYEIPPYFFLSGMAAGAFILARMAERFGGPEHRDATRLGTYLAAAAVVPCAPLLIKDLGDPLRFHHMLRIFKPQSPMNLGSWTLTAFGGVLALAALREWSRHQRAALPPVDVGRRSRPGALAARMGSPLTNPAATALIDGIGVPVALTMACYTGVLLSGTALPVWSKNVWIAPLFAASAMHSGASAISLALEMTSPVGVEHPAVQALSRVNTASRAAEAALLAAYLRSAGSYAGSMTRGEYAPQLWGGAVGAGLVLPEALERLPAKGKPKRWLKIAGSVLGLAGAFALRWAFVHAGHHSAQDPKAQRDFTRAQPDNGSPAQTGEG